MNPFMPNGLFYFYAECTFLLFGQVHFLNKGCLVDFIIMFFLEISELNANSVDPD